MLSVADIKTVVESIVKDTKVKKIMLFGSYAKGIATVSSDIDLFMYSDGEITGLAFFELKYKLENALSINIDLLPDLDVIPDSPVECQIKETGVVIYERKG
jgi:predicted nucleotidyltransferase